MITGTLESFSREEAKAALEALGAKVSDNVSKKTTGVVVGESPGSKAAKAEKAGVPILSEADLKELVKDAPTTSQPDDRGAAPPPLGAFGEVSAESPGRAGRPDAASSVAPIAAAIGDSLRPCLGTPAHPGDERHSAKPS